MPKEDGEIYHIIMDRLTNKLVNSGVQSEKSENVSKDFLVQTLIDQVEQWLKIKFQLPSPNKRNRDDDKRLQVYKLIK